MKKILLLFFIVAWISFLNTPALATFSFTSNSWPPDATIINPDFETALGSEWQCDGPPNCVRDNTVFQNGSYSYKLPIIDDGDGGPLVIRGQQAFTVTPNKAIIVTVRVRDTHAGLATKVMLSTGTWGGGTSYCSVYDNPSNINVWTDIICNIPSNNTASTLYLSFGSNITAEPGYIGENRYIDNITVSESTGILGEVTLNLPVNSSGRTISLYDSGGVEKQVIEATSNSVTFTGVTNGSYFFRVTDTEGTIFLDNSDYISLAPQTKAEVWEWTNANLTKDATWNLVLNGDTNSNGNCLDNGETGCYMRLQRNGSNFLQMSAGLGSNLALNKTVVTSSTISGTCGQVGSNCNATDGNVNTRWTASGTTNQWVCVDLGSVTSFNKIQLTARPEIVGQNIIWYAPPGNYTTLFDYTPTVEFKVSPTDTGCNASDFQNIGSSTSIRRLGYQQLLEAGFATQNKRYIKISYVGTGSNFSASEIFVYNESANETPGDIEHLQLSKDDYTYKFETNIRYDSYINEQDGSITFTKNYPGWINMSVNYKQNADGNSWVKRFTITALTNLTMGLKNVLQSYEINNISKCFYTTSDNLDGSDTSGTCGTYKNRMSNIPEEVYVVSNDGEFVVNPIIGFAPTFPAIFGLMPDNGANAHYKSSTVQHNWANSSQSISSLTATEIGTQIHLLYSERKQVGDFIFYMLNGKTYTFDVIVYRSVDPTFIQSNANGYTAYADAKGKTYLSKENKIFWTLTHQKYQPILIASDQLEYYLPSMNHYDRMWIEQSIWGVMGLNDREITQSILYIYRYSTLENSIGSCNFIPADSTLSLSSPSLVDHCKVSFSTQFSLLLGFAITRGHISVRPDCPLFDKTCIFPYERDDLLNNLLQFIPNNGENNTTAMFINPGFITSIGDTASNSDVSAYETGSALIALRSLLSAGAKVDPAKVEVVQNLFKSFYSASDGYILTSKYGFWQHKVNNGASGGTYKEGQGFPNTIGKGSYARFVVPSGHTNSTLSFTYRTQPNSGFINIYKNGNLTIDSPIDLYVANLPFKNVIWDPTNTWLDYVYYPNTNAPNGYGYQDWILENKYVQNGIFYWNKPIGTSNNFMMKNIVDFSGANNQIEMRVRSFPNGPHTFVTYFVDGEDCTDYSGQCYTQAPSFTLPRDGTWQTVTVNMTSPNWEPTDTITHLRFDFIGQTTSSEGFIEIDYIAYKQNNGAPTNIEGFDVDTFRTINVSETVNTGDVIEILADASKNTSASGTKVSLDKLTIGGIVYEENDSNFQCGTFTSNNDKLYVDCVNGFNLGWKRWKHSGILVWDFLSRVLWNQPIFSDSEIISHIENMPTSNLGNGTIQGWTQTKDDYHLPENWGFAGYLLPHASRYNASSSLLFDGILLKLGEKYLGDTTFWYKWDEKSYQFKTYGTWAKITEPGNEPNKYYQHFIWQSSTAGSYIEVKGITFSDIELYLIVGAGQGSVKVYFDNGSGYDAGIIIDLATSSNPIYQKLSQAYSPNYKVKIEVISGVVGIDYARIKSKFSEMFKYRLEIANKPYPMLGAAQKTNHGGTDYGTPVDQGSTAELFYNGEPLQSPKRRYFRFGQFHRRKIQ